MQSTARVKKAKSVHPGQFDIFSGAPPQDDPEVLVVRPPPIPQQKRPPKIEIVVPGPVKAIPAAAAPLKRVPTTPSERFSDIVAVLYPRKPVKPASAENASEGDQDEDFDDVDDPAVVERAKAAFNYAFDDDAEESVLTPTEN
jgi:hypothetical protein